MDGAFLRCFVSDGPPRAAGTTGRLMVRWWTGGGSPKGLASRRKPSPYRGIVVGPDALIEPWAVTDRPYK